MSDTFCVIPWTQLAVKPNGSVRTCCLMSNSPLKEKGQIGFNLGKDSIYDGWNSSLQTSIRKDLLDGIQNINCKTCWEKEKVGLSSKRQFSNKLFKDHVTENIAREYTDNLGNTLLEPISYDLRFGNLCNLKCVMCHPDSSSNWVSDYVKIFNEEKDWKFDWYEYEKFWEDLENNISSIRHVYMCGGEPLLIERHYYFLEKCVKSGHSKNIILEYDSNITIVKDEVLDFWKQFKEVQMRASIDDYGDQNDYIRYPSNFKIIKKNLKKLYDANIKLGLSLTISIFNSFTFINLINYIEKNFPKIKISPRMVSSPSYLDIRNLPQSAKDYITNEINYDFVSSYLKYKPNDTCEKFVWYAEELDKLRKTDWRTTFSQLQKYYD